mmetsp:Transcript_2545/g.2821  ORF Transcript_2545/g.2821 Transcript_2545/m.2821 type:complete len:193 (+) Transcript_2545:1-579(+)
MIVGETRPQLPVITKSISHDIQPRTAPTPPLTETTNVPRIESRDPPMDFNVIDPSLSSSFDERQTDLVSNSVYNKSKKQEEVEKYNDLIVNHNRQVEEYNKVAVIENDRNLPSESSSNGSELQPNQDYKIRLQKLFIPLETYHETPESNKCKKALNKFIMENSASFNNLLFIESDSFKRFINTLREHPNDPI